VTCYFVRAFALACLWSAVGLGALPTYADGLLSGRSRGRGSSRDSSRFSFRDSSRSSSRFSFRDNSRSSSRSSFYDVRQVQQADVRVQVQEVRQVVEKVRVAQILVPLVQVTEVRQQFAVPSYPCSSSGYQSYSAFDYGAPLYARPPCYETTQRVGQLERAVESLAGQQRQILDLLTPPPPKPAPPPKQP
jgi:hypothetical protein